MRIAMFTNTYLPHVGGVAQSVHRFAAGLRGRGHEVLVVAPEFAEPAKKEAEEDVYRLPALPNFNGSDFSLVLPVATGLRERLDAFRPDLLHAHHPFLVGDIALRIAARRDLPLVFTHHTMYEHYTHYVPGGLASMRQFVIRLSTGYANLCERVIAPSESIAALLRERGVRTPVEVLPTGVDTGSFGGGDGAAMRRRAGIPAEARVIGHLGRLAPEKNLRYLARAAAAAVDRDPETWFVVVGGGPSQARIRRTFKRKQLARRLRFLGKRTGDALVDAYHAMDVFAFASKTETQGMVLVEALSAGVPVVALDAPGAREVVQDGENGRLVEAEAAPGEFAQALLETLGREREEGGALRRRARASAEPYDTARCVEKLDALYETVCAEEHETIDLDLTDRSSLLRSLEREWNLWANRFDAFGDAMGGGGTGGGEDSGDGEGDEDDEDDGGGSA